MQEQIVREGKLWPVDSTIEKLAKWIFYALIMLPGRPSERQKLLGQAIFKFLAERPRR